MSKETVESDSNVNNNDIYYENIRKDKNNDFFCFVSDFDHTGRVHRPIIESHYHSYFELIYIISGKLTATINAIELIGTAGDMFIILPGETHSFERRKGCKYICIQIDPSFILTGILSSMEMRFFVPISNSFDSHVQLFKADILDQTDIPRHIQNIVIEYDNHSRLQRLAIRTHASDILLWILRQWEAMTDVNRNSDINGEKLSKLTPVLEIINKDYNQVIKADRMAKIIGMSTSYFSRYFSSGVGMGFTEYLNYVRINEAERLIVSTDMSIAEVAKKTGFSNTSYFITQFKRQFQISPKKYKQTYCNNNLKRR